jgi:hypothetical protein
MNVLQQMAASRPFKIIATWAIYVLVIWLMLLIRPHYMGTLFQEKDLVTGLGLLSPLVIPGVLALIMTKRIVKTEKD